MRPGLEIGRFVAEDDRAMRVRPFFCATLIGLVLVSTACQEANRGPAATRGTNEKTQQVFHVRGVVQELMPEKKKVRIEHENIPDYMEAMSMEFEVKDAKELAELTAGDQVTFRMIVTDDDGWIEDVKKTGRTAPVSATPDSILRIRDLDPLEVGDMVPDYQFTNEMNQVVRFSDFRGKALAFTFIFTRCPFPTFCPRMSSHFADTQKRLRETPDTPTNWHFLTISFDPAFDTPEVLGSYAKGFEADPARWNFATSSLSNIVELADQVGLVFYQGEPDNPATLNHNLRTVVLDPAGRVHKILPNNEWTPEQLAAEIMKAARATASSG